MATALDLLMSTNEDVNLLSEESDICTIDAKTRAIFVPSTIIVGGVQSDKNAERIKFSCPKIVGDNLDLSKFSVRINFENVSSVDFNVSIKDQYICDDVAVDGENVTFSWLIGRNAARYMGTVRFIVCAVKTDSDSNINVEWNTAIAEVPVLEGIEIDQPQIGQEEKDVINQLLELTKSTSAEAVQNVNSAKEQAIKDIQSVSQPDITLTVEGGIAEAKATGEAIGSLKEDIKTLFSGPYIQASAKTTVNIVNGDDIFSNVTLKKGHEYVVLSDYTGILYLYNDGEPQNRYYFADGYCEFTPNTNRTMVSGSGTFTTKLIFVDVSDQPSYKDILKRNGYDYVGKHHVGYRDLDALLGENFIPLVNIWNRISTSIAVKSDSIDKSNINGNNFIVKINDNKKDGSIIFSETLKAGNKYAIFYNAKANSNYNFSLRLYDSGWVQHIINASQTANVVVTDTIIVSVNTTGNFSIDLTSENNGTEFTGTLKVYDITGFDSIVETFDFENLKDEAVELRVNRSQQSASDNHLNGKKIVFYGDSITAQNKFPVIVKEYYGINAENMGVGGSTIFYRSETDMSSDSRISNIPSDADIVMIMGGTNDWGKTQIEEKLTYSDGFDRTKFKGAVAYIIQKIQQQCPNAKIIWCTTIGGQNETRATSSPTVQYLPQKDQFGQSGYTFRNAEIEVCNTLGIEVCDTWSCGINGNNAYTMIGDTVHPTDAGAKLIANYIIGHLKSVII